MYQNIFVVVKLLSAAKDIIEDQNNRSYIANLSLQAGEKSMTMTAFKQAFDFSCNGIELLSPTVCWDAQYDLSLKLYDLAAKAAYCVADYRQMNSFIDEITKNVTCTLHLVQPLSLKIRHFNDRRMYKDAIGVAGGIIDKIDADVSRIIFHDITQSVTTVSDIESARLLIVNKSVDSILKIRPMDDENANAIMLVLRSIVASTFFHNIHLMFSISCKFVCPMLVRYS